MATELDEGQKAEVVRIRARIATLIEGHFATGKPAYYLSQLGNQIGEADRKLLENLTHKKMSQFVADAFDYKIGRSGQHDNILYLIAPAGTVVPPVATPRYNSRFWAAFKVPLQEGERRFIDIETFDFAADAAQLATQDDTIREIDAKFLPKGSDIAMPDVILGRIAEWLDAQGLDQGPFLIQRNRQHSKQESLLTALINALDKDQQKRVSLPLDVIKTLETRHL
ncbi:hypothetical protein [Sphingomonas sp. NFX23]|uniref:hypothetical protein n=1 Tax=Sphingomonas sp. NFX23 TaxID=2819532 RepID=UPI003CFB3236